MDVQIEYLIEGRFTLNSLLERGVSEEALSRVERTLKLSTDSRDEKLYFVGFFELDNKLFISFPKSLNIDLLTDQHARALITLMRKISSKAAVTSRIPDNAFLKKSCNIENLSNINLAEFILFDFLKYGDLTFKSLKHVTNNTHEPNWTKTIESMMPITSGANHIYDRWISNKKWAKHDLIIKEIHNTILHECVQRYGLVLGVNEKEINIARATTLPKNAIRLIDTKLREVYVQRDILILKALRKWLEKKDKTSNFEFYGTQYFHIVWEEICSYLFSNCKDEPDWKAAFKKPEWTYYDTGQVKYSSAFEVDIISQGLEDKLILADAKYYDITSRDNGILGVSDLSKQINYETQLSKSQIFISNYKSKENLINLFIFPANNTEVQQELFCEIKFPELHENKLYGVNFDTINSFDRYCANNPLSSFEIDFLIKQIS